MLYKSTSTVRLEKVKENTEMTLNEQLKWFQTFRSHGNQKQREIYKKMLKFVHARLQKRETYITKQEIKLFDLVKILLDGGWIFEENTLSHALAISGIEEVHTTYRANVGGKDYRPDITVKQILQTAYKFCELLGFANLITLEWHHKPRD